MSNSDVKPDRRYTKEHEWAKVEGGEVVIGVTAFAVEQLGDITMVNLDARVGDSVTAGKAFGTIESVKTLSDLFAPVTGRITRVNTQLDNRPELVNEDCYGAGWMIALTPANPADVDALLDAGAYGEFVASAAH